MSNRASIVDGSSARADRRNACSGGNSFGCSDGIPSAWACASTRAATIAKARMPPIGKGRPDRLASPLGGSERSERGGTFIPVGKGRPDRLIRPLGGSERSERGGTFILAPGGRDSPAHARALPRPLVGEHGEAHVIAPAAGDLHVTP